MIKTTGAKVLLYPMGVFCAHASAKGRMYLLPVEKAFRGGLASRHLGSGRPQIFIWCSDAHRCT